MHDVSSSQEMCTSEFSICMCPFPNANVFTRVTVDNTNLVIPYMWLDKSTKNCTFQTFNRCLFDLSYMCSVLYKLVRLWPTVQLYVKLEPDYLPSSLAVE